ncbi:hypothetical protein HMPREF0591_4359, partial [Mycobacterium parascrofulaceum ATCC BAA-614]
SSTIIVAALPPPRNISAESSDTETPLGALIVVTTPYISSLCPRRPRRLPFPRTSSFGY